MHLGRPVIALNPRLFGRGPARDVGALDEPAPALSDDLKLFAATFVAGFVFVSILIG